MSSTKSTNKKKAEKEPPAATLSQIRKEKGVLQTELAESLGVKQAEISKIESRNDLYVSTLRTYVEALGGQLELRARFPDKEIAICLPETKSKTETRPGKTRKKVVANGLDSLWLKSIEMDFEPDRKTALKNDWFEKLINQGI